MLIEPLIQQLHSLRLKGMAAALEQQLASPDQSGRSFEDRLALMIQHELTERASYRMGERLRWARLPMPACVEDLDTRAPRGIDPAQLAQVTDLSWISEHLNVLITGPTGVGKSYLGSALAHAPCRADFSVRCFRLPRLVEELARYAAMQRRSAFFRALAKADLLVLDDFGLAPLADETVSDLLEILDDHYDRRSTLITSQLPIDQWHAYLGDRTVADAILDRLVHNSYRSSSRESPCAGTRLSTAKRPHRRNQKAIDPRPLLTDSLPDYLPPHHRPGISRNTGLTCAGRRPAFAGIRSEARQPGPSSDSLGLRASREARLHSTWKPVDNGFIESFNARLRDE